MCGIVGYSGNETKAKEVILSGLEKLEYRGYDSAGIAIVMENQELFIEKKKGKLAVLKEYVEKDSTLEGKIGMDIQDGQPMESPQMKMHIRIMGKIKKWLLYIMELLKITGN